MTADPMTGTTSTATTTPPTSGVGAAVATTGGSLTGTWELVRFMLRRDRVRLPAWTLGIAAFWLYYTRLVPQVYATTEELEGVSQLMEGPMGRLYTGPAHGFEQLTHDRFIVGAYGLYVLLVAALMSILLVVRHTRADEQAGRAELVRANVVGRDAPLTAALLVAVITNLVVSTAIVAVTVSSPHFGPGGSLLFGAGVGAAGLAFASLAALTAQVTEFPRAASSLAGAGLGAAFVLRALGDMTSQGGSPLSWLSPLAWSQQTAPFVLDRWWPLALPAAFAVAVTAVSHRLSSRRDLGAGMLSVRAGPAGAAPWLGSPFAFALRLQRAGIVGWTASLAVAGLLFGAFADAMLTSSEDLPDVLFDVTGGEADIVAGYLSLMTLFMALIIGVFAILAVQSLRTEETSGRAEPVLATPVSRTAWLGAHLAATALGIVVMLTATGLATGLGAMAVTGEAAHLGELPAAHLAFAAPLLLLLALAALLFALAPRALSASWLVLGYGLIVGVFGPAMDLPSWAHRLSPFEHVARYPLDPIAFQPPLIMGAVGACGIAYSLIVVRERDLDV